MSLNLAELEQLERTQRDVWARIGSDPLFADVPVIRYQPGNLESEITNALSVLNEQSGKKIGACAIVMPVDWDCETLNLLMGERVTHVRVLASPLYNDSADGTGKSASVLAMRVAKILQHFEDVPKSGAKPSVKLLTVDKKAIQAYTRDVASGIEGQDVFHRAPGGLATGDKVATPAISGTAAAVTIACATAGAAIYYTTDGSYPGTGNVDAEGAVLATLYSGPFAAPAGTPVRAGAQHPDLVPSNTVQFPVPS